MNGYDAMLFDLYKNALNRRHERDIYENKSNLSIEQLALGDAIRELNVFMSHNTRVEESIETHEKVFVNNA